MTTTQSSHSSSSSSSIFRLRDCVTLGVFLLALLQNLGTYWKDTKQQLSLLSLEQQQHQYSTREQHQHQQWDAKNDADSRRVAVVAAATTQIISNNNTNTAYYADETTTTTIRRWGCNLRQTPLIYVHIGKAGGGMVRARFAASALDFGVNQSWHNAGKAYYPVRTGDIRDDTDGTTSETDYQKAYFCNSGHPNFRAHGKKSFEGTLFCHATTPLGQAVACPVPLMRNGNSNSINSNITSKNNNNKMLGSCHRACTFWSDSCHVVYVGHNLLGSEMHWLPPQFLSNWWKNDYLAAFPPIFSSSSAEHDNVVVEEEDDDGDDDKIQAYLQTLTPGDSAWCPYMNQSRPDLANNYQEDYAQCSVALGQVVDKEAFLTVQARHYHHHAPTTTTTSTSTTTRLLPQHPLDYMDWSHIYASMPVLRTTIIRDPFSWLVSKFFWHGGGSDAAADDHGDGPDVVALKCDDVEMATMAVSPFHVDDKDAKQVGWANRYALNYITYLCGEDCAARYHQGIGNLQQMERQAANNLRHSFAVVGLLQETDTFYDMVTKRVQYVNMSLNPSVQGLTHSIGKGPEQDRCKDKFANASFQALLKERSPIIAAIDRLYHVGVQVNRFQLEELQRCPTTPA